jgi:hypothetical protein
MPKALKLSRNFSSSKTAAKYSAATISQMTRSPSAQQFSFCGARLCAKHQPQRVDMPNRLVLCGRAAAGRDDTAALLVKMRIAVRVQHHLDPRPESAQ